MAKQVKSKQRVADHGEVFTAEREVNAMLDLVKQETERIDSRFLEPACGDGNFLAEILRRKMAVVKANYRRNPADYEKYAVIAVTSIYGIDILQDNVEACQERLFGIWNEEYTANCKKEANDECRETVRFILRRNILCGNALTLKQVDSQGKDTEQPIIFSEWSVVLGSTVKRRDFRLDVLMRENEDANQYDTQLSLFSDDTSGFDNWEVDPVTHQPIPKPIKEYPPTDYRRLKSYDE